METSLAPISLPPSPHWLEQQPQELGPLELCSQDRRQLCPERPWPNSRSQNSYASLPCPFLRAPQSSPVSMVLGVRTATLPDGVGRGYSQVCYLGDQWLKSDHTMCASVPACTCVLSCSTQGTWSLEPISGRPLYVQVACLELARSIPRPDVIINSAPK